MLNKTKHKNMAINISTQAKEQLTQVMDKLNLTQAQAIELAISRLVKEIESENKVTYHTPAQQLGIVLELIMKYNIEQKEQKEPKYFLFPSTYFLRENLGLNISRDINPFLDENKTRIEKHYKDLKIKKDYAIHPDLQGKDSEKKNVFFQSLIAGKLKRKPSSPKK